MQNDYISVRYFIDIRLEIRTRSTNHQVCKRVLYYKGNHEFSILQYFSNKRL